MDPPVVGALSEIRYVAARLLDATTVQVSVGPSLSLPPSLNAALHCLPLFNVFDYHPTKEMQPFCSAFFRKLLEKTVLDGAIVIPQMLVRIAPPDVGGQPLGSGAFLMFCSRWLPQSDSGRINQELF